MSPRKRKGRVALGAALCALAVPAIALAIPPGGPSENRHGASVTIASPRIVAPGALVSFTGTGFSAGEEVSVKIDDGLILPQTPAAGTSDVYTVATADGAGHLVGTVDLANTRTADQAALAAGAHRLRLLSSAPRSVHADFAVRATVPAAAESGVGTGFVSPPADQLLEFPAAADPNAPYADVPRLVAGSLVPVRWAGWEDGQAVNVRVNDAGAALPQGVADASGAGSALLDLDTSTPGTNWLRILGSNADGHTPRSIVAPFAVVPNHGRDVTITTPEVAPGGAVAFTTTGLTREPADYIPASGDGQTLDVRLGNGPAVRVTADAAGVATGSVPVPAALAPGTYELVFSIGFAKQSDFPQAVLARSFEVTPTPSATPTPTVSATPVASPTPITPPAPTATPTPPADVARKPAIRSSSLRVRKHKVSLSLAPAAERVRATLTVRTRSKVRLKPGVKAKLVTLARRVVTIAPGANARSFTLPLTKDGKALLKRRKTVKAQVRVQPPSGAAITKNLTLRR